ncbi:hypothetical protein ACAG26_07715 [Mycobacterium sp. pUA109]|uniref:hypothetical protein n=1 Tax=Mycobacterium sp. pUA109 TaxID=3238982 RepID=UPI00351AC927
MTGESITDLSDGIKGMRDTLRIQLTLEQKQLVLDSITTLKDTLSPKVNEIDRLNGYGNVGTFRSANDTRTALIADGDAIKKLLSDYVSYLDELHTTLDKCITILLQK